MPENFAVRITTTTENVKRIMGAWSKVCDKLLAYEHIETGKIHSHLLIMGCTQTSENLKNLARANGVSLSGNGQWTFKTGYKDKHSKTRVPLTENTMAKYITYMSKGRYDAYYNKGFEVEYLNEKKSEWEAPNPNKSKDAVVYEEFAKIMSVDQNDDLTYSQVCGMARKYAIDRHGAIVNQVAMKEAAMLARTYCWRYDISIPWDKIRQY